LALTTILITGVGRGIGNALATTALQRGWSVVGSVRDVQEAKVLEARFGNQFQTLVFDVTYGNTITKAAKSLDVPIDIVINNAGIIGPERQSTLDMDFDGFAQTLAVNVLGPLRVSQAFLPHLKRSNRPRLITVSSKMGTMASAQSNQIAYRASKTAVNKVMQGLATDLKSMGIAVASVHPGWVRTDMGGRYADIDVNESASGIIDISEHLDITKTGKFLNYDGSLLAW
jgi:NAD(P)-dependent dehydrogenase (short-subunit alcohol dehydrogenase family)